MIFDYGNSEIAMQEHRVADTNFYLWLCLHIYTASVMVEI